MKIEESRLLPRNAFTNCLIIPTFHRLKVEFTRFTLNEQWGWFEEIELMKLKIESLHVPPRFGQIESKNGANCTRWRWNNPWKFNGSEWIKIRRVYNSNESNRMYINPSITFSLDGRFSSNIYAISLSPQSCRIEHIVRVNLNVTTKFNL